MKKSTLQILGAIQIVLIFTFSLIPGTGKEHLFPHADKVTHAFAYMLLTFTYCELSERKHHLKYFLAFTAMGVGIEFLQKMTGYRSFDLLDMAANMLGCLSAYIGARKIKVFRLYS
jgi:VanZ family protein